MQAHRALAPLLLASLLTLALVGLSSSKVRRPLLRKPDSSPKTGCYIIGIREKATEEQVQALLAAVIKVSDDHKMYGLVEKATKAFTVKLSPYTLEMVRGMEAVDYIEEEGFATGDSPDEPLQWHLDRLDQTGYPLDYNYAPIGDGEGVDIFILDSGINFDHKEFEYRAKYAGRDPVDEYSIANEQENYQRQNGRDCHGHGTHVASLSAGKTFGVAKKATVYSVRVLNCNNGAPWSVVLSGMDYVSEFVAQSKRPSVASLSLSGDFYRSVNEAVASLVRQGIHVVVAAGNGGVDACTRSPASSSSVITVGGTRNGDGFYVLGSGSNFGSCVDIFAPGEQILAADWKCSNCSKSLSGTSMATPIVSGSVAVYLGRQPMATPADIKRKIINEALSGVLSFEDVAEIFHTSTTNKLLNMPGSCGGSTFIRSYTPLVSPNYPQPYPPHLNCIWHITVGQGLQVVANISWVHLEGNYDILRLYEGECCNRTHQVAQFSGDIGTVGYSYTSAGGELSLQLLTDGTGSAAGFTGSFTKVYAGTDIRVPEPDIEFPSDRNPSAGPSHIITLRFLSPKRARSRVAELLTQGYKVTWITTHFGSMAQNHAFDIILTNNSQVDTRVYIDLTDEDLNETIHTMKAEGYSLSSLADRERGKAPNTAVAYTALFRPASHLIDTEVFLGDTVEVWRERVARMNTSGHRLISQSFTSIQGNLQVSTVFTRDKRLNHNIVFESPPNMFTFANVTFFEFTRLALAYARRSYYLTHLEVSQPIGDISARFSAILIQHTAKTVQRGNWFRWGLNEEAVNTMITLEAPSWDPYVVSGYSHQGNILYYVAFQRHVP